jgi:hypothetical protein
MNFETAEGSTERSMGLGGMDAAARALLQCLLIQISYTDNQDRKSHNP